MNNQDTITAVATPPGRGGIGIVRVSGPAVSAVAEKILGMLPPARQACFKNFLGIEGDVIDQGLALFFPSPKSFTGEDVLELQAHGGPVLLDLLLQAVLSVPGTRIARPGEFSERAFLNGKMDLLQAEAVADLIDSASKQAVHSAARSLQGEFSRSISNWKQQLVQLRVFVEGAIDFPEEEIDFLQQGHVRQRLEDLSQALLLIQNMAKQGSLLREGLRVVIAGKPNVGKSSLINRLAGEELAIVSPIPGTTRDLVQQQILIHGMPMHIIDTAGLREAQNQIEREGIKRTQAQIQQADRILWVTDQAEASDHEVRDLLVDLPVEMPISIVINKIDLRNQKATLDVQKQPPRIALSAKTGQGIELLRDHLAQCMGLEKNEGESVLLARQRHLNALARAAEALDQSRQQFARRGAGELLAEDLRQMQHIIGEITGEFTNEELLGEIFSQFCIGK